MDRILLFGYLEECPVITAEHVKTVLEELSQEIANQQPSAPAMSVQQPQAVSTQSMLSELSAVLDSALEQKIRMAKELDVLLKRQQQLLNSRDNKES